MPPPETPLRKSVSHDGNGVTLLADRQLAYRDGAESDLLDILRRATDLSSDSDELVVSADGWAQTYHLHPARANVLRALDLPASARVLEIGAGCGALTRYLGETCHLVDAVEPVGVRAQAARLRTRELDNVEVFVGELADVPDLAAYDVVVVAGVLEYVGQGRPDVGIYEEFLRQVSARLVDDGVLVLAIENALGVKYLAGAPEDHSNRPFDSLHGYPSGGPARTFSRTQLESLIGKAGFCSTVFYGAFPDYKLTRAVFGELPTPTRSLLYRIPQFPSPDWLGGKPRVADERRMWTTLVEAGADRDTPNSFLVVAAKSPDPVPLWPTERAGVFFSVDRRKRFMATTEIDRTDEGSVRFRRTTAGREELYPYVEGDDLITLIADQPDLDPAPLLKRWLAKLAEGDPEHQPFDLVPHNLLVDRDGDVEAIDIEDYERATHRDQVVRRGIFWLAYRLAFLSASDRWPGVATVGDLARTLGALVGLSKDGAWLEQVVDEEALIQATMMVGGAAEPPGEAWTAEKRDQLASALTAQLGVVAMGASAQGEAPRRQYGARGLEAEVQELTGQLAAVRADHEAVVTELADARHRLLTSRDHALGAEAELGRLRRQLQLRTGERDVLQHQVNLLGNDVAAVRSSASWLIGNAVVRRLAWLRWAKRLVR